MPLQVGLLTAQSFIRGFASVGGGSVVLFLVAASLWFILASGGQGVEAWPRFLQALYALPPIIVGPGFVAGAVSSPILFILGFIHLNRVRRNPPTDAVIGPDGIRVLGTDLSLRWDEIVPHRTEVVITQEPKLSVANVLSRMQSVTSQSDDLEDPDREEEVLVTVGRLMVPLADGDVLTLAKADNLMEMDSLDALCETVQAAAADEPPPDTDPPPTVGGDVQVLVCTNCSAPVHPEDVETVICEHCASPVAVPRALREQVRAAGQVAKGRRETHEVVRDLVNQPGADGTRRLVQIATAVAGASWVLMWLLVAGLWAAGALTLVTLLLMAGTALALSYALYHVMRLHMTSRGALRLLTLRFGARPPDREGDPHQCRTCGAPLRAVPEQMVVRCVYCDTDNILDLDLRRQAPADEDGSMDLEEVMAERRMERKRFLSRAGATLAGTLVGALCTMVAIVQGFLTRSV